MYEKINWEADTLLTPARFNQMETQYDEVKDYWTTNPFKALSTEQLIVEVLASAPTHGAGRLYWNTTAETLNISDGSVWEDLTEI